jgi:adenosylcobinamide-phosphate synthase
MLVEEARGVGAALDRDDLDLARERLRSLVSRPTKDLTAGLVAAAAIESLAENLGDSIVGPWLYYAGFGLPGAAVYRVVDTADSMYGYRGDKEWLGKAAAKTDDVLSCVPSRLAAAAIVGAARLRLGSAAAASALTSWRADGGKTDSPNAGRPMSAMAGALQRRLEKPGHYVLGGAFPEPTAGDVRRAVDLTVTASGIALAGLAGALVLATR